uniref:Dilute domain-containing protein n=1 Tax=Syphacia muris TaxID=451379 RepID=A0A0N5AEQ0_9BILA
MRSSDFYQFAFPVDDCDDDSFMDPKYTVGEGKSIEENVASINTQLNRLVSENLDLQNKLNRQSDELSETKAQLRGFTSGLGPLIESTSDSDVIRLKTLRKESIVHSSLLEIFNVPEFTRIIIGDLKPRLARLLTPCLPAYLLLAAFRYHDHAKDETGLTGLFTGVHDALKDTVMQTSDMDVLALWLVNSWRLFNLLRQYSGENNNEWFAANSETQNSYRMQSFDLEPIRNQLSARVEDCFQSFMKRAVEPVLSPKIVPAILQHESGHDSFLTSSDDNLKRQSSKEQHSSQKSLDDLVEFLNFIHTKLKVYGADMVLLRQVFGQMAYWICALALNHLMFRKELCNFEKAIQIKHNVTEIQNWLGNNGFAEHKEALEPLVQASHLLQSKKDEHNLDTLCGDMTSKLKPRQVISILQHYSPSEGFEERRMDSEFLIKVAEKLAERTKKMGGTAEDQNALIMMGTYLKPFDLEPFVYSEFPLETLSLPTCLHLQSVCQLL